MINLVLTLPISCAMQKPTGIIALLDEAWYVAQHYKFSFFVTDWQIAPHLKKMSCVDNQKLNTSKEPCVPFLRWVLISDKQFSEILKKNQMSMLIRMFSSN